MASEWSWRAGRGAGSFAAGVQSIVALKAQAGKNKLKAANTARGIGIIIKQLLPSIQPSQ